MQEVLAQLFSYVWGVWRHRWLALAVTWVVAIGGWTWVWQMPEAYEARARVFVDTNSVLRPLLQGLAVQPNVEDRIGMLSRTLLSRPNLEKLMRMTDLDLQVTTEAEKDDMLSDLGEAISLKGGRRDLSLYSITVQDPDRETAKRIAQALITVFIESSLSGKREASSGAADFLDEQIAEYESRLIAAENRAANFRQKYVDILPSKGGYYRKLNSTKQKLSQSRLMLKEMENRQLELQRQIDGEDPVFITSGVTSVTGRMSPLDTRIQAMRESLDALSIRYTEKHPEVRQLSALIDALEAEKASEYRRVRKGAAEGYTGLSNSPVYQGMRSMLAETKAKAAELTVRVAEYERRVVDLENKVNSIPEIEAQLKQLDRDYAVIKGQHAALMKSRESARLSQDMEQNASDVTFRVIDPPFVPFKPSEPNKVLLNGAVLLFGLVAGLGVSLMASLLYPVIGDVRTLVGISGLPVLGSVTINLQPEQKRKERYALVAFASLTSALLVVYIGMSLGGGGMLWS